MDAIRGMCSRASVNLLVVVMDEVFFAGESLTAFSNRFNSLSGPQRRNLVNILILRSCTATRPPGVSSYRRWLRKRGLVMVFSRGHYTDADDESDGGALKILVKLGWGLDSDVVRKIGQFL